MINQLLDAPFFVEFSTVTLNAERERVPKSICDIKLSVFLV